MVPAVAVRPALVRAVEVPAAGAAVAAVRVRAAARDPLGPDRAGEPLWAQPSPELRHASARVVRAVPVLRGGPVLPAVLVLRTVPDPSKLLPGTPSRGELGRRPIRLRASPWCCAAAASTSQG